MFESVKKFFTASSGDDVVSVDETVELILKQLKLTVTRDAFGVPILVRTKTRRKYTRKKKALEKILEENSPTLQRAE